MAPIATSPFMPAAADLRAGEPVELSWDVPMLRDPVTTATLVIGELGDGRRVTLDQLFGIDTTPVWTGSPTGWWFGS